MVLLISFHTIQFSSHLQHFRFRLFFLLFYFLPTNLNECGLRAQQFEYSFFLNFFLNSHENRFVLGNQQRRYETKFTTKSLDCTQLLLFSTINDIVMKEQFEHYSSSSQCLFLFLINQPHKYHITEIIMILCIRFIWCRWHDFSNTNKTNNQNILICVCA